MVKKHEKGHHKDRHGASNFQDSPDGVFVCTGNFQLDYNELCRRNEIAMIPPIVQRARRPSEIKVEKVKEKSKHTSVNPISEMDSKDADMEPEPKTFVVKESSEYFKPTIQVHTDHAEKYDSVSEIYIRGWKIDTTMMNIFKQCWPALSKLHTVNLWHVGLTGDTLIILSEFLPDCPHLKYLTLDGNWVKEENWYLLIEENSRIQSLSLRYCFISDKGAEGIGRSLGTLKRVNTSLISLNLSGNRITDIGCEYIARGLRLNRTLLALSLANNQIGNKGCFKFAEVLSRFPLTHDEVVERRKSTLERLMPVKPKFAQIVHHRVVKQATPPGVEKVKTKLSPKHKKEKAKETHDDEKKAGTRKEEKLMGKKEARKAKERSFLTLVASVSKTLKSSSSISINNEVSKTSTPTKEKKRAPSPESVIDLTPTLKVLDSAKPIDGQLWVPGNTVLMSLNMSRNHISLVGVQAFIKALQNQAMRLDIENSETNTGLVRLNLQRNQVSTDHYLMKLLDRMLAPKEPFKKPDVEFSKRKGSSDTLKIK